MQSSLCSRALQPSLSILRPVSLRSTLSFRRYLSSNTGDRRDRGQYPELDDILGSPATTFDQLINQLETLIKHPNPPRNYADALAKDELRRMDYRDLTPEKVKGEVEPERKMLLRQRPRMLRNSQRTIEQNAEVASIHDENDVAGSATGNASGPFEVSPLPEQMAANLGITAEQQERRRIWMTKIKGYKDFRQNLVSMDTLLRSMDSKRAPDDIAEASDLAESAYLDPEHVRDIHAGGNAFLDENAEFEELIRKSWKAYDEDIADMESAKTDGTGNVTGQLSGSRSAGKGPRSSPPGTRSFHTSRLARKDDDAAATGNTADGCSKKPIHHSSKHLQSKERMSPLKQLTDGFDLDTGKMKSYKKRISRSRSVAETASDLPKSMISRINLPSVDQVRKHVREGMGDLDEVHIPISASVRTGDVIEIRYNMITSQNSPFSVPVYLGGVIQKVTGRFHFNVIQSDGVLTGARETRVGFVSKGLLFDKKLLKSSGAKPRDIERILEYGREMDAYEAEHGKDIMTSAEESEKLRELQRLAFQAAANQRNSASGANTAALSNGIPQDDIALIPAAPLSSSASGISASEKPLDGEEGEEEPVTHVMLRVFPRITRMLRQKAEQLMRSRYRELEEYWGIATARGKQRVTVDALAELIFGDSGNKPIGEVERLATYMHLISNPLQYIPDGEFLFVTNMFFLRHPLAVEKFQKTQELMRENLPEFQQFIRKARQLVAYSNAHAPTSPIRSSIDPDYEAYKETMKCRLTDWESNIKVLQRPPPTEPMLTSEEVQEMKFDKTDFLFIDAMRQYVFEQTSGYKNFISPFESLAPPILKKMRFYPGCGANTVTSFLVDIGVWPHWFNPFNHSREHPYAMLGVDKSYYERRIVSNMLLNRHLDTVRAERENASDEVKLAAQEQLASIKVNKSLAPPVRDSILTRKQGDNGSGVSILGQAEFYSRDICEDIRHDFGNLPVYTIDHASTRDVDDGVSIETVRTASGEEQKWIHIHIADPTAVLHPGHIASHAAHRQATSMYFVEQTNHMLSLPTAEELFSLSKHCDGEPVRTMSFSALIGANGDIIDYKVRPGIVNNIKATPYESLAPHLSFGWQGSSVNSLAKLQSAVRHSTIIHPFVPSGEELRMYGDTDISVSEEDIAQLRDIQAIARRHTEFRNRNGAFSRLSNNYDISVGDATLNPPTYNISNPKFVQKLSRQPELDCLKFPKITTRVEGMTDDPARTMVSELMIIAGRLGARYASEHGPSAGNTGANANGVLTSGRGIPFFYRVQDPPNFDALSGVTAGMPLAFDDLSPEQANSAKEVFNAVLRRASANNGIIDSKTYDEVRHMMNASVLSITPGHHTIMGIKDEFGYTRVTSPIRRIEDMIGHWQLKAQMLAEHGDGRDKSPWYWNRDEMVIIGSPIFRRTFSADKVISQNVAYWSYTLMQRMESDARHGRLQLPPAGFYDPNSPLYYDLPWAYYNPQKPGPLVWTATVDNRDETRQFISLVIGVLEARAALIPRPIDRMQLPFAGTKVRVQLVSINPVDGMLLVKLAPEEYQPPETPKFWRHPKAFTHYVDQFYTMATPPAIMPKDIKL